MVDYAAKDCNFFVFMNMPMSYEYFMNFMFTNVYVKSILLCCVLEIAMQL